MKLFICVIYECLYMPSLSSRIESLWLDQEPPLECTTCTLKVIQLYLNTLNQVGKASQSQILHLIKNNHKDLKHWAQAAQISIKFARNLKKSILKKIQKSPFKNLFLGCKFGFNYGAFKTFSNSTIFGESIKMSTISKRGRHRDDQFSMKFFFFLQQILIE